MGSAAAIVETDTIQPMFCDMRPRIHAANQRGCNIQMWGSNRSIGKTYSTKQKIISEYLKKGRTFLYVRRNRKSLDAAMRQFFVDVGEEYPNEEFRTKGHYFYHVIPGPNGKDILEPMGMGVTLLDQEVMKGSPLPNLGTILMDEMIPENGKYLNLSQPLFEPMAISSMYFSAARSRGQAVKEDVNMIFLYNAFTDYTPYYTYFGIDIAGKNRDRNGNVWCEIIDWKQTADAYAGSQAFKGLSQTVYGQAAVTGSRILDNMASIESVPLGAETWFYLYYLEWFRFSVKGIHCYVSRGNDPTFKERYALITDDNTNGCKLFADIVRHAVRIYVQNGRLHYADGHCKSILQGVLK